MMEELKEAARQKFNLILEGHAAAWGEPGVELLLQQLNEIARAAIKAVNNHIQSQDN